MKHDLTCPKCGGWLEEEYDWLLVCDTCDYTINTEPDISKRLSHEQQSRTGGCEHGKSRVE